MDRKKNLAIIGSGVSGLSAAYFLKDNYNITVYEKNAVFGGHSRTISVLTNNKAKVDVDTGFIVLNDRTYPLLNKLLKDLEVQIEDTEMSFAISANDGQLEWAGSSLNTLFAQRKNLFNISMLRGVMDIIKFNAKAKDFIKKSPNLSLGELIKKMNLRSWFRDYYILPMGGAIWSCPSSTMLDFPATTFVSFFDNHGLLSIKNRPQWHTIKNKSKEYVKALVLSISKNNTLKKNCNIEYIDCLDGKIQIKECDNDPVVYDEVLFACHPVEILPVLKSINPAMQNALKKFSRKKNIAYTHFDSKQMPKEKKCWSSWNYLYRKGEEASRVAVTYWMNKLQHINPKIPLFVTLNPISPIPEEKIYDTHEFYHPVFDQTAIDGQLALNETQGDSHVWFCGAYLRYGFHEDGVWSAVEISKKIKKSDIA